MDIALDAVLLPAHDQRDLAVRFESDQTVDHMTACLLQAFCPDNVVFLVKTGFELNEDGHLLAKLRGLRQRRDDRRVAADPVERLLDRQHILVHSRLTDEIDHRIKRLIRVMHQDIAFFDLFKQILSRRKPLRQRRCKRLYPQMVVAVDARQLHRKGQIHRTAAGIDCFFLHIQILL